MKDKSLLLGVANYLNQKTTLNIWAIRGIIILSTIFFAFYVIPFYFFVGLILFLYSRNKCLYCGKEMNGKKGFCSNCGKKKIPFKQGLLKVATIFISLVVLILLFAFILPENNSNLESKDLLNQTNISSNFYNESLTPQDSEIEEVNLTINLNKIPNIKGSK